MREPSGNPENDKLLQELIDLMNKHPEFGIIFATVHDEGGSSGVYGRMSQSKMGEGLIHTVDAVCQAVGDKSHKGAILALKTMLSAMEKDADGYFARTSESVTHSITPCDDGDVPHNWDKKKTMGSC